MSLYPFPLLCTRLRSVTLPACPVPPAPLHPQCQRLPCACARMPVHVQRPCAPAPSLLGKARWRPSSCSAPVPAQVVSSREEPRCFEHVARLGVVSGDGGGLLSCCCWDCVPVLRLSALVRASGRTGGPGEAVPSPRGCGVLPLTEARFGKIWILFPFSFSFRMWKSAREESRL